MPKFATLNFRDINDLEEHSGFGCIHLGEPVGTIDCGCAGKYRAYWCNLQQGHCTLTRPDRSWRRIFSDDGLHLIGYREKSLEPCLNCSHRRIHSAKKLLDAQLPSWHFVTNEQLAKDSTMLAAKLPPISGVAGIPVSGMLVAPFISTLLHVPLYEASEQHGLRPLGNGYRGGSRRVNESDPILIIDDTCCSGGAITRIKNSLGKGNYLFAAVYAQKESLKALDYYGTELEQPHLLEWNLPNSGYIRMLSPEFNFGGDGIVVDFDGVLCQDPPQVFEEERDRQAYLNWIANAPLGRFAPRMFAVPDIVSYRCEYTREATVAWLAKHNIKYDRLHLWPDDPSERDWGPWKARFYQNSNHGLFVESNEHQAKIIADISGKKVLCMDSGVVYG